jgi:5-methylcytosine-specific restriction protein A
MKRTGFSKTVLERVQERCEGRCEAMFRGCTITATQAHHRRARGMGSSRRQSTNSASNALACCRNCHERIESERRWAVDNGFLVAQHHEPTERAVWWRCARTPDGDPLFVLFDDFGNRVTVPIRRLA